MHRETSKITRMTIQDIQKIQSIYENYRNLEQAKKMAAYMKNKFPFLGVPSPLRNELNKSLFQELGQVDLINLEPLVLKLWALPEREYQYLAINLISKLKNKLTPSHLEFILELIVDKSWWDTIDALAPNFIGSILGNYPDLQEEYIPIWTKSENIWINRTAILFQLKYKNETNFNLLTHIIDTLKHKNEFFVKKAIGWALREYSKTEPKLVESYIKDANLQALSEKEGLRIILKKK